MFQSIAFYIGEKTLDLNGQEYPPGELTAEVLNISPDEYHKLDRSLVRHRVFQLLQETEEILSEARVLTEQYSLFQEPEDLEPTDRDLEIAAAIGEYQDYLEHPELCR